VFSSASIIFKPKNCPKMIQKKENSTSCFRCVDTCKCKGCSSNDIVKNGKTRNGKQRFLCKNCSKSFILDYSYNACNKHINQQIILFTKEGLGIRSTARVLKISVTTLLKRIIAIAATIQQPPIPKGMSYEVDEMRTFIGKKSRLRWIVYALERESKTVVSFNVGRRTNKTLKRVIKSLELSNARKIYTDKLKNYKYIIHKKIHNTRVHCTNHIERRPHPNPLQMEREKYELI